MKFRLSKFIPVRMTSHYFICNPDTHRPVFPERASWWQWRGHIFAHHREPAFDWARNANKHANDAYQAQWRGR